MGRRRKVSRRKLLLLLYAAALVLRLLYLLDAADNPFLDALGLDARYYDLRAREILEEGLVGDEAYFMGPLYPHLLAAVYGIAGRNLTVVRILQAMIGAFVPVLLYRIGVRLFPPAVALTAALVALFYGPLIFYTGTILYATLAVSLILWILDRLSLPPEKIGAGHLVLTGILFGLASVGKGNLVLFLPFALYGIARRGKGGGWSLRRPAVLLAGFLVVIGAATARNHAASGDLVFLTSNGGLNFYIGNGPESSGAYEKPKGLDVDHDPAGTALLEKQVGRSLTPTQVSAEWRRRATDWIAANPAAEAKLLLRKAIFFFSTFEIPQIESYRFQMRYSPMIRLLHVPFGLIAPLGLAGVFLFRRRGVFFPLSFLFAYAVSIILFFVLTRYRLPVVPVLILFAAALLARLIEAGRRRDAGGTLRTAAVVLPFFFLCNFNFYRISPATGDAQSHYRLGIIAQSRGDREEALHRYRRSIELDPEYERSRLNLGELLAVTGRGAEAETQFREAIRIDGDYPKAYLNLGTLLYRSGRIDEGREALERAVRLDPEYGKAWLHLAALSLLTARPGGEEHAARAIEYLSPEDPVRPLAAEFRARNVEVEVIGRWRASRSLPVPLPASTREAMVAELFRDRQKVPDLYRAGAAGGDPSALYSLGAYLYRRGDAGGAEAAFAEADSIAPDHPFLGFALGLVLHGEGRAGEAAEMFLRETRLNPGFLPAWKNAALLAAGRGEGEEARRLAGEYLRRGGVEEDAIHAILTHIVPNQIPRRFAPGESGSR